MKLDEIMHVQVPPERLDLFLGLHHPEEGSESRPRFALSHAGLQSHPRLTGEVLQFPRHAILNA